MDKDNYQGRARSREKYAGNFKFNGRLANERVSSFGSSSWRVSYEDNGNNNAGHYRKPNFAFTNNEENNGKVNQRGHTRGRFNYRSGGRRDTCSRRERWNIDVDHVDEVENDSSRTRNRHPPGLKGREIGMWYARRSRGASEAMYNKAPILSMATDEALSLNKALDGIITYNQCNALQEKQDFTTSEGLEYVKSESICEDKSMDYFDQPEKFIEKNIKKQKKNDSMSQRLSRIEDSDFKKAYEANLEGNQNQCTSSERTLFISKFSTLHEKNNLDQQFYDEFLEKESSLRYKKMLEFRKLLPSFKKREDILNLVLTNQVVVLSGETGCGKTTQVAQFILDDCIKKKEGSKCHIICTQPRRISAISVAQRVADERTENLGRSVGYQIRLEQIPPRAEGSILFCTTGIILQWLKSDPFLSSTSHLILDEIHERDSLSDFLICMARDLLPLRPDLKLILMSATLNADKFSKYFSNCPMIHIPGFTFDVKELYLEDVIELTKFKFSNEKKNFYNNYYRVGRSKELAATKEYTDFICPHLRNLEASKKYSDSTLNELYNPNSEELNLELILDLLHYISKQPPGAVLVFLPGWENISKLNKMILESTFFNTSRFRVLPLHSMLPTANQREVFKRPPSGIRKIVIATNIAETSITIDDIVYVIDCGKIKMTNYDKESNISTLLPEWVTLANATQRRGRAGRVQAGICYHLYTKAREMTFKTYPLPEIQRTRLEEVILQVKILKLGFIKIFLGKLMDAPDESVVNISIKMLQCISALDEKENLTPLGFHLAQMPLDPLTGKMLLMGAIFSCLNPILTVAASLSFKDPFVISMGNEKAVDKRRCILAKDSKSDHLMMVNAYDGWERAKNFGDEYRYIRENFLSSAILLQLQKVRKQFLDNLHINKFVSSNSPNDKNSNCNSGNLSLVKAVITAGLYPNVTKIIKSPFGKNKGKLKCILLPDRKRAVIHPKSVNCQERMFENNWLIYWEKMKSSKIFLHDTTMISNYPLLLFGQKLEYNEIEKIIHVDDFIKVSCSKEVAEVIQKLRTQLDELLEYKITHPGSTHWGANDKEGQFLSLVLQTLASEKSEKFESYNRARSNDYYVDEDLDESL